MERVDILADGDLVLAVGGLLELRVSSVVLKISSPVFKAMLGPRFAEGQALKSSSILALPTIALPDDHPEAIETLCRILHHQAHLVNTPIAPALFCTLAVTADKYGCIDAIKYAASVWSDDVLPGQDIGCLAGFAAAAYMLDLPSLFSDYTEIMVRAKSEGQLLPTTTCLEAKIVAAVYHTVEHVSKYLAEEIEKLAAKTASFLDRKYLHEAVSGGYLTWTECEYFKVASSAYLAQLAYNQIWPQQCRAVQIGPLLVEIENFHEPEIDPRAPCESCEKSVDHHGALSPVPCVTFRLGMGDLKAKASNLFVGVCLDCLKSPDDDGVECRVDHYGQKKTPCEAVGELQKVHY